jgi:dTDP-4-dehydrorhamnose reductase
VTLSLLVFGAGGQVGTELRRLAGPGLAVEAPGRAEADLADPAACAARVARSSADVAINAAAWTAVDRAETEEAAARVVNADAPGAMARAAAARGLPFLHLSTDHVFDGTAATPRREDAPTGPVNAYGRGKLAGERAVAAAGGPHVIVRTSWVFAGHGSNFVRAMLRAAASGAPLRVVDDEIGCPTPAAAVAAALVAIARAFAAGRGRSGLYHFCGRPAVSRRRFAEAVLAAALGDDRPAVAPVRSGEWPAAARRPPAVTLDCGAIRRDYGLEAPDWRPALAAALAEAKGAARPW